MLIDNHRKITFYPPFKFNDIQINIENMPQINANKLDFLTSFHI